MNETWENMGFFCSLLCGFIAYAKPFDGSLIHLPSVPECQTWWVTWSILPGAYRVTSSCSLPPRLSCSPPPSAAGWCEQSTTGNLGYTPGCGLRRFQLPGSAPVKPHTASQGAFPPAQSLHLEGSYLHHHLHTEEEACEIALLQTVTRSHKIKPQVIGSQQRI